MMICILLAVDSTEEIHRNREILISLWGEMGGIVGEASVRYWQVHTEFTEFTPKGRYQMFCVILTG